jgi:hypothetical protein
MCDIHTARDNARAVGKMINKLVLRTRFTRLDMTENPSTLRRTREVEVHTTYDRQTASRVYEDIALRRMSHACLSVDRSTELSHLRTRRIPRIQFTGNFIVFTMEPFIGDQTWRCTDALYKEFPSQCVPSKPITEVPKQPSKK